MSDRRALIQIPTWMAPSARRAGWDTTALGRILVSTGIDFEVLYQAIAEYSITNPALWTGTQSDEGCFLDRYETTLAQTHVPETDTERVSRLLALERLRGLSNLGGHVLLPWVLCCMLGRATEVPDTFSAGTTIAPGNRLFPQLFPQLQATQLIQDSPTQTKLRAFLQNPQIFIADGVFFARPQAAIYGGAAVDTRTRFSPFGRAGNCPAFLTAAINPVLTDVDWNAQPATAETATAVVSAPGNFQLSRVVPPVVTRPNQGHRLLPGLGNTPVLSLTSSNLPQIKTPTDARRRGDPALRTPGDAIPGLRYLALSPIKNSPRWSTASFNTSSTVPLDLDSAATIFNSPYAYQGTSFGTGTTVPALTQQDQSFSSDFA